MDFAALARQRLEMPAFVPEVFQTVELTSPADLRRLERQGREIWSRSIHLLDEAAAG